MIRALLLLALSVLTALPAAAGPRRYAVIIGHDRGRADEVPLEYATADARKVHAVLTSVGDVDPGDASLLLDPSADAVRGALAHLNARLRAEAPGQAELIVYYSGHADAAALHLGGTELPLAELEDVVRGSAARFRLLVLDACRSGALTRIKGVTAGPPVALSLAERSAGEGAVFLTSSTAGEDAQESDQLQGSFFTHYWVSGLLGAADENGDGAVDLMESYRHAYDRTVQASSRTWSGTQHPTYQAELRGTGEVVLTRPGAAEHGTLALGEGYDWLLIQGGEGGAVMGEVAAGDPVRTLGVAPGTWLLRGRAARHFVEGEVAVVAGESVPVDGRGMQRLDYARLVRKGLAEERVAWGVRAGPILRAGVETEGRPCLGLGAGAVASLRAADVSVGVEACRGGFDNQAVRAVSDELAVEARLSRALDLRSLTLDAGVGLGAGVLAQRFPESVRDAGPRAALAGRGTVVLGVERHLAAGIHLRLEGGVGTRLFLSETDDGVGLRAPVLPQAGLMVGRRL